METFLAEDKLESNATLAQIEAFLTNDVCGLLPSFLRPECDALVSEYAPQVGNVLSCGCVCSDFLWGGIRLRKRLLRDTRRALCARTLVCAHRLW